MHWLTLLLILGFFSFGFHQVYAETPELFSAMSQDAEIPQSLDMLPSYRVTSEIVTLNIDVLDADSFNATLLGNSYTISKDNIESRGDNDYSWFGSNSDGLDAILVVDGTYVTGLIYAPEKTFQIFPISDTTHEIYELDTSRFPSSGVSSAVTGESHSSIGQAQIELLESVYIGDRKYDPDGSPNIVTIDVYAVVTDESYTIDSPPRTARALAQLAVNNANNAYEQNQLPIQLDLVDSTGSSGYVEAGTLERDLRNFANLRNDIFDRARSEAVDAHADISVLFVKDYADSDNENPDLENSCSIAQSQLAASTTSAIAVVDSGCIAAHAFTAAIGYIQGAGYNIEHERNSEFSHGHGYYDMDERRRTIMSANVPNCDDDSTASTVEVCERERIWSDPHRNFFGTTSPAGTTNLNWNAKVLFSTAPLIASLRGDVQTYDDTRPTGSISLPNPIPTSGNLKITATFSEEIHQSYPPHITIMGNSGSNTSVMNRISDTVYEYDYTVQGDSGRYQLEFSNARDIFGNRIITNPTSNRSFDVVIPDIPVITIPVISVAPIPQNLQSGDRVTLDASGSTGDDPLTFRWGQFNNGAPIVRLQNDDTAIASFIVPYATSEQTTTFLFGIDINDGERVVRQIVSFPATLTIKPIVVIPPQESTPGFVETVLFEDQFSNFGNWNDHFQWDIERPEDPLPVDTNRKVAHIEECDDVCYLELRDTLQMIAFDSTELSFYLWFGEDIEHGDSLGTDGAMFVQSNLRGGWQELEMIEVNDDTTERWFPVTIDVSGFINQDTRFRFVPMLENDDSFIQIDAVKVIGKKRDNIMPVISNVPDDIIMNVSSPSIVNYNLPTVRDNLDKSVTVSCTPISGVVYSIGTTTVTCQSQDSAGNMASASFDITLNLVIPLEITLPDDLTLEATGELTSADLGVASTNKDATITNDAPDSFPLGITTVTWTATDDSDNSVTDTQLVTVQDTTQPMIEAPQDFTFEATGLLSVIQLDNATATDTVDTALAITNDAPISFPIGTATVTWTATDDSGNSATAIQLVTVQDTTKPVIMAPEDVILENAAMLSMIQLGTANATDTVDTSLTITNDAPLSFLAGTTTITWTATDDSGNSATDTQLVTVRDTIDPMLILPADITKEATGILTEVDIGTATVTDNVDSITATNDAPDSFPLGTTTVTWTATDSSENTVTATQRVTVQDTTNPYFDASSLQFITAEATGRFTPLDIETLTALDIVDPSVTVTHNMPGSFPLGITIVTWTARDSSGNMAIYNQFVVINDRTSPDITAPDDTVIEATGLLTLVNLGTATAADLVDTTPTITNDAPTSFPIGTTTVTWTATDDFHNSATDIQLVTVQDTTDPVLMLPADITKEATGILTMVDIGTATVTDNVDSITATNDAPDSYSLGETLITWTATDSSENTATAIQRVTVQDTTNPTITAPPDINAEATGELTTIELGSPTVSDIVDSNVAVTSDAPTSFPIGTTTVTWTAIDSMGNSATATQIVTIRGISLSLPEPIDDLSASAIAANSLTLSWTQPELNDGTLQTYNILSVSPHGIPVMILANTTSLSHVVTDLDPNEQYSFSVRTITNGGASQPSNVVDILTLPSKPDPVLDLTVTGITTDSLRLEWTQPDLNGGTLQTYRLVSTSPHGNPQTFLGLTAEPFFDVTGLTLDTDYSFRVQARTEHGFSGGNAILDTRTLPLPSKPDPVLDLTATGITSDSLRLEWTQPDLNGGTLQAYRLVSTSPHGNPQTFLGLTAEPFFDVTGLTPDTDYSFRVQARTEGGFSGGNAILDTRTLSVPLQP